MSLLEQGFDFFKMRFQVRLNRNNLIKFTLDTILLSAAYILAYLIRFEFHIPAQYFHMLKFTLPGIIGIGIILNFTLGIYQSSYEYASVKDLIYIFWSVTGSVLIFVLFLYFLQIHKVPRSILITFWMLSFLLIGGLRFSLRIAKEFSGFSPVGKKRVLVIGAGSAGEMIIRQMKSNPHLKYYPAGLIDDDPKKHHTKIHGVPVLGGLEKLSAAVKTKDVEEIIIATPSATPTQMRRIVRACEKTGIDFKTVPGPRELVSGDVSLNQIRKVRIEDLLEREPVHINIQEIEKFLSNKRVLITGAGGSIGSELARQILRMTPGKLICLDRIENSLFYLEKELAEIDSKREIFDIAVGDILDVKKLEFLFYHFQPQIVFHAAAYKHVPLMELHPEEAIRNNVFGTLNVLKTCSKFGVEKFIQISTDKAVNPTSIMGVTKRVAELLVNQYATRFGLNTIIVRFGNVLASYGSVVPLFQKQIAKGGPVTVTHPEMKRFFMTIPEAVKLILEATKMGNGNEIYILDMGEPVKILEFAKHLISLSGFEPEKDIPIEIIGVRPGEKMEEELWNASENPRKTAHHKILMAKCCSDFGWTEMEKYLGRLHNAVEKLNKNDIYDILQDMVPEYTPFKMEIIPQEPEVGKRIIQDI